jgi:hypothetical protein
MARCASHRRARCGANRAKQWCLGRRPSFAMMRIRFESQFKNFGESLVNQRKIAAFILKKSNETPMNRMLTKS